MSTIDKRLTTEQQVLIKNEISRIRSQMESIVFQLDGKQIDRFQAMMLIGQFKAMGAQVLRLREMCQHVWAETHEYVDDKWTSEESCVVCQLIRPCSGFS